MEYRNLGRSGLRVSAVSLGGWLTFGGSVDDRTTYEIVGEALERGVNTIDLADVYAKGAAEEVVGRALRDRRRSDLVLASKVYGRMGDGPNDRGLSRKHIVESIDGSLRRLGTDYLDVYYCHRADPDTPLHETAAAMSDLVQQGKILYWGTSMWRTELLEEVHDLCDRHGYRAPVVEQPEYSLVTRVPEDSLQPFARRSGTGIVAFSPLAGGLLTGKYDDGVPEGSRGATTHWLDEKLDDALRERLRAFSALARERGAKPSQLALAWVLSREQVASVIIGATSPAHVIENVGAVDVEVDADLAARLDDLFPR